MPGASELVTAGLLKNSSKSLSFLVRLLYRRFSMLSSAERKSLLEICQNSKILGKISLWLTVTVTALIILKVDRAGPKVSLATTETPTVSSRTGRKAWLMECRKFPGAQKFHRLKLTAGARWTPVTGCDRCTWITRFKLDQIGIYPSPKRDLNSK